MNSDQSIDPTLLVRTDIGLYCPKGGFYIDPAPSATYPASLSVITHGHADHARPHSERYIATTETAAVMRQRINQDLNIRGVAYGEQVQVGEVTVSLHPAGHVLGSAQVRVAGQGQVWVVSGDYKRDSDPTCVPFEVVPCDVFITEATFGLPAYRWNPATEVAQDIFDWWEKCRVSGKAAVLFCYAFGKAQRILAELTKLTDRQAYLHGAMENLVAFYRSQNVEMLPTELVGAMPKDFDFSGTLVIAPPSAAGSSWMRRFKTHETGFASGWMRIRGNRRRRGYDRGFVLSDHADWPSLLQTIHDTGAKKVLATHGQSDALVRYLNENGFCAADLSEALPQTSTDAPIH